MSKLYVNELSAKGSTNTAIEIADNGVVTLPNYPAFYATRSASYGITAASGTVALDVAQVDTHDAFDTGTYTYTVPVAGLWMFRGTLSFTGNTASERFIGCALRVNGSDYADLFENWHYGATNAYGYTTVQTMRECAVNDTVLLRYASSDAGNFTLNHDGKRTHLMGWLLG